LEKEILGRSGKFTASWSKTREKIENGRKRAEQGLNSSGEASADQDITTSAKGVNALII